MPPVRGQFRRVRQLMRKLKREFPASIVVYHLLTQVVDPKNGQITKTWKRIAVRRAMVLPAKEIRSFVYDLSFIAANKNFTYGGLFDSATRRFIIDRDDMKGVVLKKNDYITQDGQRWDVGSIDVSDELRFISPICKRLDGMPPSDTHPVDADDVINVVEDSNG